MGRPKKYTFISGDILGFGWVFVKEGNSSASFRRVVVKCPKCGSEIEQNLFNIYSGKTSRKLLKSCGCFHQQGLSERHRARQSSKDTVAYKLYCRYRKNAASRNHIFELTEEEFGHLCFQDCFYCQSPPELVVSEELWCGKDHPVSGVDRLDSSKGYSLGNVVPCCKTCNLMKNTLSKQTFLEQIAKIHSIHLANSKDI